MQQSWEEDDLGQEVDRDSADFRQLRNLKLCLQNWIREHGGTGCPTVWDSMEKVTLDGKVLKRVILPGNATAPVKEGMFVAWQYTAFVEPNFGKVIDATRFTGRREIFRSAKPLKNWKKPFLFFHFPNFSKNALRLDSSTSIFFLTSLDCQNFIPDHPRSTQITPDRSRSSQILFKSFQIIPDHFIAFQITPNHSRSTQITPDRSRSSQILFKSF